VLSIWVERNPKCACAVRMGAYCSRRATTLSLPELLRQLPHSRVILETAAEAFRIADAAKTAGHEVGWCRRLW